jgi:hypothetical protein
LNAADIDTSDPYCQINCNGTKLETSVKWRNLNPIYYEKFEIDVTNAFAKINIIVYDKDYIGSDDFLGQISLRLDRYSDGLEHHETHQLKGEDEDFEEDFDRGEIEIKVRWAARRLDTDLVIEHIRIQKATILQSWARRIASITEYNKAIEERKKKLLLVKKRSIQITNTCRIRIATKIVKHLRRRLASCIKIQKRARIRQARLKHKALIKRYQSACDIQRIIRGYLAMNIVKNIKANHKAYIDSKVTIIQKHVRRVLARMLRIILINEKKVLEANELAAKEAAGLDDDEDDDDDYVPVSSWIHTFGCDPDPVYKFKRNRRITEYLFQKMLKLRYIRFVSKPYGIVHLDEYPARQSDEDMKAVKNDDEPMTDRDAFIGVFFPQFSNITTHRAKALEFFELTPHTGK